MSQPDEMRFEQALAGPPETVWPYVTDPIKMNEWSEARITLVSHGAAGRPDSVGTLREVLVPSPIVHTRLLERITLSRPPEMFGYQVIEGGALKSHTGEITLTATPEGCVLSWRVLFEPHNRLIGWAAKAVVQPAMRRSLRKLAQVVADAQASQP